MLEVMIDIETFGNGSRACITQVGACYFERHTGMIGNTFKRNIDARSSVAAGALIDADTVYWWLSQDNAAIESIVQKPLHDIKAVFSDLNEFLGNATAIWSHATFDFVIISNTYKMLGIKPSFKYNSARDIRTLVDLAGVDTYAIKREGVHHDALADCFHQVKYCVQAFNRLQK